MCVCVSVCVMSCVLQSHAGSKGFGAYDKFDNVYYSTLLQRPWTNTKDDMASMIGLPSDHVLPDDPELEPMIQVCLYLFVCVCICLCVCVCVCRVYDPNVYSSLDSARSKKEHVCACWADSPPTVHHSGARGPLRPCM